MNHHAQLKALGQGLGLCHPRRLQGNLTSSASPRTPPAILLVVFKNHNSRHASRRRPTIHNKSRRVSGRSGVEGSRRRDVGGRSGFGGGFLWAAAVAATAGPEDTLATGVANTASSRKPWRRSAGPSAASL